MDELEEMKKALDEYKQERFSAWVNELAVYALASTIERCLPTLLAELEARRVAMGEDITTASGFSGRETEAMR